MYVILYVNLSSEADAEFTLDISNQNNVKKY